MTLEELKARVLEDGKIDAAEVEEIRDVIFADEKIDKEEADMLFAINDAVTDADNTPEWRKLFVEAITSYVLEDENTPGVVDQEEGKYLYDKIAGDGALDETEQALLRNIREKATEIDSAELNSLMNIMDAHADHAEATE
jgi:uncharacterized tellurite resistance protein B-like protein